MAEFVGNWYLRFRSPISSSRTGQKIRQEPEKLKEHATSHADGKCGNKKKCRQLLTPHSGTVFYGLSNSVSDFGLLAG